MFRKEDLMRALVATDFGIYNIDGRLYTRFALSSIIIRYKEHFGELVLCAPITHVDIDNSQLEDITGIVESFIPINRDRAFLRLDKHRYDQILENCDLVIARLPSSIAIFIAERAYKKKKPVFSEVMGCTWDAMWNHGYLGKIVAVPMFVGMKNVVRKSDYALYVTEKFLQNRYHCSKKSVGVSDVVIPDIESCVISRRKEKIKKWIKQKLH